MLLKTKMELFSKTFEKSGADFGVVVGVKGYDLL